MNGPLPPPAPPARPSRWRRFGKLFIGLTAIVGVAAGVAPTVVSKSPELRDALIRRLTGNLNGTISIEQLSIGWFSPLTIDGLKILPPSNSGISHEPLVDIHRVETDRGLWSILWNSRDLGTVRIERPNVFVKLHRVGSNFGEVFGPTMTGGEWPRTLDFGVRAQVIDGTLRWDSYDGIEPWQLSDLNAVVGVRTAEHAVSRRPELFVERGKLLDQEKLSVGLCNDLLQFAAPVLADATRVQGNVTVELDDWRLPWGDFSSGDLSGRLIMHTVDVGPGPFTQGIIDSVRAMPIVGEWARTIPIPRFLEVAREQPVPFKMLPGGLIHHQDLRFSALDFFDVASEGTVGLDESIDLTVKLGVRPPRPDERYIALLRQLATQTWTVKLGGNLGKPTIENNPLKEGGSEMVSKMLQDWAEGRQSLGADIVDRVGGRVGLDAQRTGRILGIVKGAIDAANGTPPAPPPPPPPAAGASTVVPQPLPPAPRPSPPPELPAPRRRIFGGPAPSATPSASPTSSAPAPRRPLLRRGIDLLIEATEGEK